MSPIKDQIPTALHMHDSSNEDTVANPTAVHHSSNDNVANPTAVHDDSSNDKVENPTALHDDSSNDKVENPTAVKNADDISDKSVKICPMNSHGQPPDNSEQTESDLAGVVDTTINGGIKKVDSEQVLTTSTHLHNPKCDVTVPMKSLNFLRNNECLDDEIMNSYMNIISMRFAADYSKF